MQSSLVRILAKSSLFTSRFCLEFRLCFVVATWETNVKSMSRSFSSLSIRSALLFVMSHFAFIFLWFSSPNIYLGFVISSIIYFEYRNNHFLSDRIKKWALKSIRIYFLPNRTFPVLESNLRVFHLVLLF